MKKVLWIAGAILVALLALTVMISEQGKTPQFSSAEQASATAAAGYTVCELNGRIAVYRGGELWLSTDTQVSALPKADQTRLRSGIAVYSDKELKTLLEDLCS